MSGATGAWSPEQRAREHVLLGELLEARQSGDRQAELRARDELVLMHSGFVRYAAHKYLGTVNDDLLQAGMLGLINAIDRFDPSYGTELTSFAVHHILGTMREYRDSDAWSVRVPRRLRQLNGQIRALRRAPGGDRLTVLEIAERLDADPDEVVAALSADDLRHTASLDAAAEADRGFEPAARDDDAIAQIEARETIRALLWCLDDREREVVTGMFFDDRRQHELADALGISQSQVSRVLKGALDRMREAHAA